MPRRCCRRFWRRLERGRRGWERLKEYRTDCRASRSLARGHYTDRLKHRKPLVVIGYAVTALATASFGLATHAMHVHVWASGGVAGARGKVACEEGAAGRGRAAFGVWAGVWLRAIDGHGGSDCRAADGAVAAAGNESRVPHGVFLDAVIYKVEMKTTASRSDCKGIVSFY